MNNKQFSSGNSAAFYYVVKDAVDCHPDCVEPGHNVSFSSEALMFSANPSLAFPTRDVEAILRTDSLSEFLPPIDMMVNFSGLTGSSSPLPEFYGEAVLCSTEDYSASGKLLDMFNHRLISFIYRDCASQRHVDEHNNYASDDYSSNLFSLLGMRDKKLRICSEIDWQRLLPFALHFRNKNASQNFIETIVSSYFSIDLVKVLPFVRRKTRIPASEMNVLGVSKNVLARNVSIGGEVTEHDIEFIIRLGPLTYRAYHSFLPLGENISVLRKLIAYIMKRPMVLKIELLVASIDIPQFVLVNSDIFQLGCNSLLGKPKGKNFSLLL